MLVPAVKRKEVPIEGQKDRRQFVGRSAFISWSRMTPAAASVASSSCMEWREIERQSWAPRPTRPAIASRQTDPFFPPRQASISSRICYCDARPSLRPSPLLRSSFGRERSPTLKTRLAVTATTTLSLEKRPARGAAPFLPVLMV